MDFGDVRNSIESVVGKDLDFNISYEKRLFIGCLVSGVAATMFYNNIHPDSSVKDSLLYFSTGYCATVIALTGYNAVDAIRGKNIFGKKIKHSVGEILKIHGKHFAASAGLAGILTSI